MGVSVRMSLAGIVYRSVRRRRPRLGDACCESCKLCTERRERASSAEGGEGAVGVDVEDRMGSVGRVSCLRHRPLASVAGVITQRGHTPKNSSVHFSDEAPKKFVPSMLMFLFFPCICVSHLAYTLFLVR